MKTVYDEKIWQQLRETWENTPRNVGWAEVCRIVSASCMSEVPVAEVVSKKAKREGWKKKPTVGRKITPKGSKRAGRTVAKKVVGEVVGSVVGPTTCSDTQNEDLSIDCVNDPTIECDDENQAGPTTSKGQKSDQSNILIFDKKNNKKRTVAEVHDDLAVTNKRVVDVVRAYRRRTHFLGQMVDACVDTVLDATTVLKNPDISDTERENTLMRLQMASGSAEMVDVLSKAIERMAKMDVVFYGIVETDFKDQQTQARNAALEEKKARLQEAEAIAEQQRQSLIERQQQLLANGGNLPQDAAMAVGDNGGN